MIELILVIAVIAILTLALPLLRVSREKNRVDVIDQPRHKTFLPDTSRFKMADATEGPGSFSGYGSVFGNIDSDQEKMAPGAYAETLPKFIKDGFIGVGHDWKSGVATITDAKEDNYGLYMEAAFHSDTESQMYRARVMERMQRGKSVGLSVGFRIRGYEWDETGDILTITKADLYEVSIVTVPANSAAGILSAKSGKPLMLPTTIREFESVLRDLGYSQKEATQIASQGFKGFGETQRDSDDVAAQIEAARAAFLSTLGRVDSVLMTVR